MAKAFRRVPRHLFAPAAPMKTAYTTTRPPDQQRGTRPHHQQRVRQDLVAVATLTDTRPTAAASSGSPPIAIPVASCCVTSARTLVGNCQGAHSVWPSAAATSTHVLRSLSQSFGAGWRGVATHRCQTRSWRPGQVCRPRVLVCDRQRMTLRMLDERRAVPVARRVCHHGKPASTSAWPYVTVR